MKDAQPPDVGLLIITHDGIGETLLSNAVHILGGRCPMAAETLAITDANSRESYEAEAAAMAERLDRGAGVLILTDIYGASPANVARSLDIGESKSLVAGVNLPMILKILNYSHLGLVELTEKAIIGGQESIMMCELPEP
jgi:PTS system ascorbate-specific IIA component